jgi:trehalose 6-phosphate phosphatase
MSRRAAPGGVATAATAASASVAAATAAIAAATSAVADVEGTILVVCDFDGTLSHILPDPRVAGLVPEARRALRRLGRIARRHPDRLALAILSGRTALDVAGRVRIGGVTYLGDHGLQGGQLPAGVPAERLAVGHDPRHAGHLATTERLGDDVARLLADAEWLWVEPKGPSVAFHYRVAPDAAVARSRILAALGVATASLPRRLAGRRYDRLDTWRILELRPEGAPTKGAAVEQLLARHAAAAVVVMGDDRSDAEAFRVVAAARTAGRVAAGLAIGIDRGPATPHEVRRDADAMLPGPEAAGFVLRALARRLEAEEAASAAVGEGIGGATGEATDARHRSRR